MLRPSYLKDKLVQHAPLLLQDAVVSVYNHWLYRRRHSGVYGHFRKYYEHAETMTPAEVSVEHDVRLRQFLDHATAESRWYHGYRGASLGEFAILEKNELVENIDRISTISPSQGVVSRTGGTTGASLKVVYRHDDVQERFAVLDAFRAREGYALGKRVAWFSGKDIATLSQVRAGRCYRDDYLGRVRFFSTFHISSSTWRIYWRALQEFRPEYVVGFPSSVADICARAADAGERLEPPIRAFFPTAETVLQSHRDLARAVLGGVVRDQYASSEGAPFILECSDGRLHANTLTGVFEVVDADRRASKEGELLVTSFATRGTPLIRYRIGDRVALPDRDSPCACGSPFPSVLRIDGRTNDYVLSTLRERVNLGNLSNSTKGINGILRFQVVQDHPGAVTLFVVGTSAFDEVARRKFLHALRSRLGLDMQIDLRQVDHIPQERSGKFRLVKNRVLDGKHSGSS